MSVAPCPKGRRIVLVLRQGKLAAHHSLKRPCLFFFLLVSLSVFYYLWLCCFGASTKHTTAMSLGTSRAQISSQSSESPRSFFSCLGIGVALVCCEPREYIYSACNVNGCPDKYCQTTKEVMLSSNFFKLCIAKKEPNINE